ncbi:Sulfhydryl oxidase [Meloidogyne graminicola]|uniref:Sulfhydryl oxidase n=1 Tax=Meloidogyne graminicola TaxID=189291 RepID=A0A8S9ZSR7_9BILA|nr:Sulfhydryl oxidase [Meloidogyne graminicola]
MSVHSTIFNSKFFHFQQQQKLFNLNLFKSLAILLFYCLFIISPILANDRPTLYAKGDNVLELDINTFNKSIYNKPTAFFVEFYSSWCGHCIEYKPLYVKIATAMRRWRKVVVIAVLNCADEINAPVCREHAIDAFPSLKYFHVNSKNKDDSINFKDDKRNVLLVTQRISEYIKEDFDKGLAPSSWPKLEFESETKTLIDIWKSIDNSVHFLSLIVDKEQALNAFSLIINYANDNRIKFSLTLATHPIVKSLGNINIQMPGLIIFEKSKNEPIFISSKSYESWIEMQEKIDEILAPYPKPPEIPLETFLNSPINEEINKEITEIKVNWKQFEVQYQDLIATMHYMLTVEIPRNPVLGNTELQALKSFIHLMRRHGPGSVPVRRLFYRLDNWLQAQHQPVISTDKYLTKVEQFQSQLGHPIPANITYLACRGSKSHLRGYTCGLWTIFHILTVQAYKERRDDPKFDPVKEVLEPIHQFVVQFLSCEVCSKNFDKMSKDDGLLNVHKPEEVILWLWRGHNKVNKRLKGEPSEDPMFPKQQFPSESICSDCRNSDGNFDEEKVLKLLLNYYTNVKIDKYKQSPAYKITEFENGKLDKVAERRLNPKFDPMAGKVDKLEELESRMKEREEEIINSWKSVDDELRVVSDRHTYQFIWLSLIAIGLIIFYFQYRRNRSKFWKTFYYYHDYKVLPWHVRSTTNSHKYSA